MKKIILILLLFNLQNHFAQSSLCFTYASYSPMVVDLTFELTKADYNNDGQIDFIAHAPSANLFNVILSNGTGSYLPATTFSFNVNLSFIGSGDFNNDGKQDVVVAKGFYNIVEILLGTGTGSFSSIGTYSVGSYPTAILCKDLNNDLNVDIVVCNNNSSDISVLLGNGLGGFSPTINYSVGTNPHDIVAGDFNNDSKIDLAIATNSLVLLQGNGNGTFNLINTLYFGFDANGNSGYSFKTIDFTNDNKLDLAGIFLDTLYYTKGNGNFTFGILNKLYVGSQTSAIDFADFNSDGDIDFITSNYQSKDYSIILGNGIGTFTNITTYTINNSWTNFHPAVVITADVNNDTKTDIIIGNDNSPEITVILNCNSVNVGIEKNEIENEIFSLYPNPANDVLNINLQQTGLFYKVRILNSLGQIIREEDLKNNSINIKDLTDGIYFLNLISDKLGTVSKRFVVTR